MKVIYTPSIIPSYFILLWFTAFFALEVIYIYCTSMVGIQYNGVLVDTSSQFSPLFRDLTLVA